MLNGFSLKFKLISAFLALSVISGLIGGISFLGNSQMSDRYERVSDIALPNLGHLNDMFLHFREIRINIRTLGLPDLKEAEAKILIENAKSHIEKFEASQKAYTSMPYLPGEESLHNAVKMEWEKFKKIGARLISSYEKKTPEGLEEVKFIILKDCPIAALNFTEKIDALKNFHLNRSKTFVEAAKDTSHTTNTVILTLVILGVVAGIATGLFISSAINKKITVIAEDLFHSSNKTSGTSMNLAETSGRLSQSATESAASLEETVSALEELSSMVKLNSDHAKEANSLSQASHKSAEEGKEEITKLIAAMEEMSKSSKQIEEITNVIDEIAFQTNLLALNAAVEAARAGEQGRGFAVVADAVRNLAGRSSVAAKDIGHLIHENVQRTLAGSSIAQTSGKALNEIVSSVKKVADLNAEISVASTEQANGIEQISKAMTHLDGTTQNNAATSKEVSSWAQEMGDEARALVKLADDLNQFIKGNEKPRDVLGSNVYPIKSKVSSKKILPLNEQDNLDEATGF